MESDGRLKSTKRKNMANPLDKKLNLTLGELVKIIILFGGIYIGGYKVYTEIKSLNKNISILLNKTAYIETIFKEAEGK